MPNISSFSFPQFTDLVNRSFLDGLKNMPETMRKSGIVIEEAMPQHTGEFKRFAERLHRSTYASERDEGDVAKQALVQYGYEKDLQVYTVAKEVSITKRMRVAGKNQDILDQVTTLSETCPMRMDLDLSHRLTFAWSTSYVTMDGYSKDLTVGDSLAVINTAHTLTGSAVTYSNQIPANPQFSKGALENGEKQFVENTFNNLGEKMVLRPDTIMTTDDPNTINQVRELLHATADVNSANANTFNVYKAAYKHVINPRIATTATGGVDGTKRKYWFLAASEGSDFYLAILEQPYLKTPMDGNNGEEFSSENWNYVAGSTYGITIVTGRWICGSKGDGSA